MLYIASIYKFALGSLDPLLDSGDETVQNCHMVVKIIVWGVQTGQSGWSGWPGWAGLPIWSHIGVNLGVI